MAEPSSADGSARPTEDTVEPSFAAYEKVLDNTEALRLRIHPSFNVPLSYPDNRTVIKPDYMAVQELFRLYQKLPADKQRTKEDPFGSKQVFPEYDIQEAANEFCAFLTKVVPSGVVPGAMPCAASAYMRVHHEAYRLVT